MTDENQSLDMNRQLRSSDSGKSRCPPPPNISGLASLRRGEKREHSTGSGTTPSEPETDPVVLERRQKQIDYVNKIVIKKNLYIIIINII